MSNPPYRRLWGLLLGLAAGLTLSLVSQLSNVFAMPGVPLFLPPFGIPGNIALGALLGAAVGLAAAWPENFFLGVFLSSLIGWLAVAVASYFTGQVSEGVATNKIAALIIILVPTVAFLVPMTAFFRWIVGRLEKARIEHERTGAPLRATRWVLPALLLLAAAWIGYLNLYPQQGRFATPRMHQMIQQGMQAASDDALPEPLRPPDVTGFREKAVGGYNLRWELDEKNRFAIPRPSGNAPTSAVIANFDNGWMMVCIYTVPERDPNCRGFDRPQPFSR